MVDVDNFLKKYEAQAGLSERRQYARYKPMSVRDYHEHYSAMDVYEYQSFVEREPYVEMYIPKHRFQELVERDRYYTEMSRHHDYATSVVNQQVQDEVVRKNNPAVETAWRKYQMLLELARR